MDGIQQAIKIETPTSGFLGMDSASEPTSLNIARSRRLYNSYQGKIRALTQRPGSVPVTTTALGSPIIHLTKYPFTTPDQLLATSGTTLYKLVAAVLTSATMTNPLARADITDADFTGINAGAIVNIKIIGDGGILKQYDGTEVKDVTPAADDTLPAPANVLTDINALGCKFVWVHNNYLFVSPGDNQVFYSKRAGQSGSDSQYNYFPEVHFSILVRNGDVVNGCGIPFDNVCFIPMRNGWNVWAGDNFNDFDSNDYLNTINGVIASKSVDIITYATGTQTIAFLSDDGVHEIFSSTIDTQGRQYATRNLMTDKIDFQAYGFTVAEKEAAISKYVIQYSMYLLEITRDTTIYVFGYDTRNAEWYIWTGLTINAIIENDGIVYYAGNGHLKKFDKDLNDDWTDLAKTSGVPVDFDRISGMIWFEQTGYPSTLDYYILRLKTYAGIASLDISIIYLYDLVEVEEAIQNSFLTWDTSEWDASTWANLGYTDLVNAPQRLSHRLRLPKKGFYFQIRWRNNRSEPVEIYGESLIGRSSGEM